MPMYNAPNLKLLGLPNCKDHSVGDGSRIHLGQIKNETLYCQIRKCFQEICGLTFIRAYMKTLQVMSFMKIALDLKKGSAIQINWTLV